MNHFEQLVAEWLQYNGYFVRTGVQVGRRPQGGYAGELDVVGVHLGKGRLNHIECSLDALSWKDRERRFAGKFERGRRFIGEVFDGVALPPNLEQVALLQFAGGARAELAGARVVTGVQLVHEIMRGLAHTSPASGAVPTAFPLLRTLQLAREAQPNADGVAQTHQRQEATVL
jgi:hypothetical protein